MDDMEPKKSRASRMLDDMLHEGLGQAPPAASSGPLLPRMRLVVGAQAAPVSVVRKRAAAREEMRPAEEMLPEILKEVDEARKKAAEARAAAAKAPPPAPEAPAVQEAAAPGPSRIQRPMSRIRRRFQLGFGKPALPGLKRRQSVSLPANFEDKAIYRSPESEAPLRVPTQWWEAPGLTAWAFLLPGLLAFGLFSWLPMLRGFWLSLHEVSLLGDSRFVGAANYARAFGDPQFWSTFGHSLAFCALSLAMGFWLPLALALHLNEMRRGQALLRFAFFLPFLTPTVPAVILWKWILDQGYGLANSLLALLGFADPHVPWLNQPFLAMLSVALVFLWKNTGWNALIYLTALRELPEELYEAAELDGAPMWKRIAHVSLPALRPTMAVLFVMQVINSFQIFTEVYLLTGGGPMASTEVVATYLYKKSFLYLDIGYASALAVMLFLALVAFTSARRRTIQQEA